MEDYCVYCTDWVSNKCIHRKEAVGPPNCFYLNIPKLVEDFMVLQKKIEYVFEKMGNTEIKLKEVKKT